MREVKRVQTHDGKLFLSEKEAGKHLEHEYGELICKVAREITNRKFVDVTEYIDANLDLFVQLNRIKNDKIEYIPLTSEDKDDA